MTTATLAELHRALADRFDERQALREKLVDVEEVIGRLEADIALVRRQADVQAGKPESLFLPGHILVTKYAEERGVLSQAIYRLRGKGVLPPNLFGPGNTIDASAADAALLARGHGAMGRPSKIRAAILARRGIKVDPELGGEVEDPGEVVAAPPQEEPQAEPPQELEPMFIPAASIEAQEMNTPEPAEPPQEAPPAAPEAPAQPERTAVAAEPVRPRRPPVVIDVQEQRPAASRPTKTPVPTGIMSVPGERVRGGGPKERLTSPPKPLNPDAKVETVDDAIRVLREHNHRVELVRPGLWRVGLFPVNASELIQRATKVLRETPPPPATQPEEPAHA